MINSLTTLLNSSEWEGFAVVVFSVSIFLIPFLRYELEGIMSRRTANILGAALVLFMSVSFGNESVASFIAWVVGMTIGLFMTTCLIACWYKKI